MKDQRSGKMGELVASNNNELIAAEYVPGFDLSTLNDRKYETFYISDVVSSSGVASGIAEIIGTISMTSGDLYRVRFPKGVRGVLATAKTTGHSPSIEGMVFSDSCKVL